MDSGLALPVNERNRRLERFLYHRQTLPEEYRGGVDVLEVVNKPEQTHYTEEDHIILETLASQARFSQTRGLGCWRAAFAAHKHPKTLFSPALGRGSGGGDSQTFRLCESPGLAGSDCHPERPHDEHVQPPIYPMTLLGQMKSGSIAIPPNDLPHISEHFYQVESHLACNISFLPPIKSDQTDAASQVFIS